MLGMLVRDRVGFKMCIIEQTAFSFSLECSFSRKCAGAVCVIGNDVLASFFRLGWWFSQNYTHLPPHFSSFPHVLQLSYEEITLF